jgi:hypothetical protein
LFLLSRPRRPRRSHEWNAGKAVTFIVTLAAAGSVTLAAKQAGMSRKSAYALKDRDPAFAAAWKAALGAHEGDKVEEVHGPPCPTGQGDRPALETMSKVSTAGRGMPRRLAEAQRDRFFARLAALNGSAPSGGFNLSL